MAWKDISSYSRNTVDRSPRTLQLEVEPFMLVVTRHIHADPDQWVFRWHGTLDFHVLKSKDLEAAKAEAIGLVRKTLESALKKLPC